MSNKTQPMRTTTPPDPYLEHTRDIGQEDARRCDLGFMKYGPSWCKRGGTGVFHVGLARKWDRIEKQLKDRGYDVWEALKADPSPEGIIDDLRDLRTYLMLVEAKARAMGICPPLKDNEQPAPAAPALPDTARGLYQKYDVKRLDGKYPDATYFVLRFGSTCRHTAEALRAYCESCEEDYPLLAEDIRTRHWDDAVNADHD